MRYEEGLHCQSISLTKVLLVFVTGGKCCFVTAQLTRLDLDSPFYMVSHNFKISLAKSSGGLANFSLMHMKALSRNRFCGAAGELF